MWRRATSAVVVLLFAAAIHGQTAYKKARKAIAEILDAPGQPQPLLSPTREHVLLVDVARYPTIADMSEPMLRLTWLRITPATSWPPAPPTVRGPTALEVGPRKRTEIRAPHASCPRMLLSPAD